MKQGDKWKEMWLSTYFTDLWRHDRSLFLTYLESFDRCYNYWYFSPHKCSVISPVAILKEDHTACSVNTIQETQFSIFQNPLPSLQGWRWAPSSVRIGRWLVSALAPWPSCTWSALASDSPLLLSLAPPFPGSWLSCSTVLAMLPSSCLDTWWFSTSGGLATSTPPPCRCCSL